MIKVVTAAKVQGDAPNFINIFNKFGHWLMFFCLNVSAQYFFVSKVCAYGLQCNHHLGMKKKKRKP